VRKFVLLLLFCGCFGASAQSIDGGEGTPQHCPADFMVNGQVRIAHPRIMALALDIDPKELSSGLCVLAETSFWDGYLSAEGERPSSAASAQEDLDYCEANLDQAMVYWNQSRDRVTDLRICMEEARNMSFYPALQDSVATKLSECIRMAR